MTTSIGQLAFGLTSRIVAFSWSWSDSQRVDALVLSPVLLCRSRRDACQRCGTRGFFSCEPRGSASYPGLMPGALCPSLFSLLCSSLWARWSTRLRPAAPLCVLALGVPWFPPPSRHALLPPGLLPGAPLACVRSVAAVDRRACDRVRAVPGALPLCLSRACAVRALCTFLPKLKCPLAAVCHNSGEGRRRRNQ